jgi:hypothetical protein
MNLFITNVILFLPPMHKDTDMERPLASHRIQLLCCFLSEGEGHCIFFRRGEEVESFFKGAIGFLGRVAFNGIRA